MKTHKVGQDLVFTASKKFSRSFITPSRKNWLTLRNELILGEIRHDFNKQNRKKIELTTNYRFIWLSTALIISYFISQSFLIFMTQ